MNDDGEGKKLKTPQSARRIPVHPELIKLGFIEYWQERKSVSQETNKLFEDGITMPANQKIIKNYSRNFGSYLNKIGLK